MEYRKAIFLDKDGTLIKNVPYNVDPARITLLAGVADGLRRISELGYLFIIVSNQAGVARGYFPENALLDVERRLRKLLEEQGVVLSGFYYCPHHPDGSVAAYSKACSCRKPMPGMLLRAAADFQIRLDESWMVGDILDDVEAGNRAGCKTVLVDSVGQERKLVSGSYRHPLGIADDFGEAASLIEKHTQDGYVSLAIHRTV